MILVIVGEPDQPPEDLWCRHCDEAASAGDRFLIDQADRPWIAFHERCVASLLRSPLQTICESADELAKTAGRSIVYRDEDRREHSRLQKELENLSTEFDRARAALDRAGARLYSKRKARLRPEVARRSQGKS